MEYERTEYPRPQFERSSWMNLNGEWDFTFDDHNEGEHDAWYEEPTFDQTINVPFSYETKASGIEIETFHPYVWYHRTFNIPIDEKGKRTILRFQASDYITKVWVNGMFIGKHQGGNVAFSFDITNATNPETANTLVVKVEDSKNCCQPRGKQRWKDESFGCWYVQTTGIWQTVWLEFLNDHHIDHVKMTPQLDKNAIQLEYKLAGDVHEPLTVETNITFAGTLIRQLTLKPKRATFGIEVDLTAEVNEWKIMTWSPEQPNLYDVTFRLYHDDQLVDTVNSYFGMRKIDIKNGNVLLNNRPIYQKLLLDQGYWPDTMLTPPSDEALLEDIDKTLAMGYNGVRKHQKIEDARFHYWCDKKGLLVWSEMPSTYEFSDEAVTNVTQEWSDVVQQYYNHPSIITWVPFNESWGIPQITSNEKQQAFTEHIYHLTKSLDSDRPVIVNDGWEHTISDIITIHDYEELGAIFRERYADESVILNNNRPLGPDKFVFADGYTYQGQPILITEYGGIAFVNESGWGYGNQVASEIDFLERFTHITDTIKSLPYVSGYCYTQTADVQQEVNGLLKADRTPKIALEKIREVNER